MNRSADDAVDDQGGDGDFDTAGGGGLSPTESDDQGEGVDSENGVATDGDIDQPTGVIVDMAYCSAPDAEGVATVVMLAGALPPDRDVEIQSPTETVTGVTGGDGGLAMRISASPNDTLTIVLADGGGDIAFFVPVGALQGGAIGTDITGGEGAVVLDDGTALVRGSGQRLEEGFIVIGGNLSRSTGRATPVSCNDSGCMFGLLMPGGAGDEVDLFLVPSDSRAGLSDVETIEL